jgi:hypothetical protein
MNSNEDKAWEARIDRALKELPELSAPAGLVERTMETLERRRKPSQFHQPWPMWPLWLRAVSLVSMLAFLGGLCAVRWEFARSLLGQEFAQRVNNQFSNWNVALGTLDALGRAAVTVAHHMNTWVAILCLVASVAAYFACIGLGTAAVRLAFSRR